MLVDGEYVQQRLPREQRESGAVLHMYLGEEHRPRYTELSDHLHRGVRVGDGNPVDWVGADQVGLVHEVARRVCCNPDEQGLESIEHLRLIGRIDHLACWRDHRRERVQVAGTNGEG